MSTANMEVVLTLPLEKHIKSRFIAFKWGQK